MYVRRAHDRPYAPVRGVAPRRTWPRPSLRGAAWGGYVAPALALYAVFVLWPLARLVGLSLVRWDGYGAARFVGLDNYRALPSDPNFGGELGHSLVWLGTTLVAPVALGLALALLLAAAPRRARAIARALLLVPLLLPTVVLAVVWRLFYNPLAGPLTGSLQRVGLGNLAGDWLGDPRLALGALLVPACWASFGLSMLVFGAALAAIDREIAEAAAIDGAGAWARFRVVTLPALRGAAPLATVATALAAVPSFDLVRLLTNGGPGYATTTLSLDMYGRAFNSGAVGAGAALACLQMASGLALTGVALAVARGSASFAGAGDGATGRRPPVRRANRVGAGLALTLVTAAVLSPLAWLVALALGPATTTDGRSGGTFWDTLGAVWGNSFGAAFVTSLGTAALVAVAVAVLAVPAAFGLANSRGRLVPGTGLVLLAVGLFQPSAVLIIPLYNVLTWFGLLNSPLGLIAPQIARTLPLAVLLLWGALRALPAGVLDAAAVDGAPPRRVLRSIALPLALPTLAVVLLWGFLSSWSDYLLPTIVLQDGGTQTVPLALAQFVGSVDTQYAPMATGTLLAILPLLALYAVLYGTVTWGMRRLRVPLR